MAGTYTGENGADAALNKMIKHMDRNAHRGPKPKETILSQLQEFYPFTWKEELAEMVRERDVPGYIEEKNAAKERFKREYWSQPRWQIDGGTEAEKAYITKALLKWREEWKPTK
jgi:glycogen debranching enzyme